MDGAQFGVKGDLRVCVKCKAFEKMLPAVGTPTGVRDSSGRPGVGPAPLAPFVPLFAQPTTPEDDQVLAELLQFGNDYISECILDAEAISRREYCHLNHADGTPVFGAAQLRNGYLIDAISFS